MTPMIFLGKSNYSIFKHICRVKMKPNEKEVAHAVRVEFEEKTGKLFIVFEITDTKYKQDIKKNWSSDDIEFRLVDKLLIQNNE
jgi:hypothetical protein